MGKKNKQLPTVELKTGTYIAKGNTDYIKIVASSSGGISCYTLNGHFSYMPGLRIEFIDFKIGEYETVRSVKEWNDRYAEKLGFYLKKEKDSWI